jgi:hypothetical protein
MKGTDDIIFILLFRNSYADSPEIKPMEQIF